MPQRIDAAHWWLGCTRSSCVQGRSCVVPLRGSAAWSCAGRSVSPSVSSSQSVSQVCLALNIFFNRSDTVRS